MTNVTVTFTTEQALALIDFLDTAASASHPQADLLDEAYDALTS